MAKVFSFRHYRGFSKKKEKKTNEKRVDEFFGITASGSTIKTELTGGLTAFLAMSYVIFVNPIILGQAGMPQDAVFMSTIISSAIAMLIMGLWARFPLGLAPCMSMNVFLRIQLFYKWEKHGKKH